MSLTGANLSIMLDQCNDDPYPRSLGILTHGKSVPSITDTDDISKKPFIQAQFASQTPTPYNTRVGSPIVGINARYTAGHAARMTDKLESLAVERREKVPPFNDTNDYHTCSSIAAGISSPDLAPAKRYRPKASREVWTFVNIADGSANVATSTKVKFLTFYFIANLGLTLYNKYIMLKHSSPYLLTALHCLSGVIGTQLLLRSGAFNLKPLTAKDRVKLAAFSVLYTTNIGISNASLNLVTIPFHQVVRTTSLVITIGIYHHVYGAIYTTQTYISLIPIILGVSLTSYRNCSATIFGFSLTLLGAILAAIKTVVTNRMQTSGLHLSPMELLYRMSPYALAQSLVLAYYHGEIDSLPSSYHLTRPNLRLVIELVLNGALALALNYTSFSANKKVGALTMTVAANVKQTLSVVLSIFLFDLSVDYLNVCGIIGTLAGGAWYSAVELVGATSTDTGSLEEGRGEKV